MSMRSMGSIWQATLSGIGSSDGRSRAQAPIPRHDPPHYASGFPQDVSTRIAPVTSHALQAIGHVGRQTARRDEDDVEALLVLAIGRIAADPELGRPGDAAGLARGNRGLGLQ